MAVSEFDKFLHREQFYETGKKAAHALERVRDMGACFQQEVHDMVGVSWYYDHSQNVMFVLSEADSYWFCEDSFTAIYLAAFAYIPVAFVGERTRRLRQRALIISDALEFFGAGKLLEVEIPLPEKIRDAIMEARKASNW